MRGSEECKSIIKQAWEEDQSCNTNPLLIIFKNKKLSIDTITRNKFPIQFHVIVSMVKDIGVDRRDIRKFSF